MTEPKTCQFNAGTFYDPVRCEWFVKCVHPEGKCGNVCEPKRILIIEDAIPSVIGDVRKNMGLDEDDPSKDLAISSMKRSEIFQRYMTWNGIIGYEQQIKEAIREIYGVELVEGPVSLGVDK